MIVYDGLAGLSISKTAWIFGSLELTQNSVIQKKHPVSRGSVDENTLLMREVNVQSNVFLAHIGPV